VAFFVYKEVKMSDNNHPIPWINSEVEEDEVCIGNYSNSYDYKKIPMYLKRVGKIPCDYKGIPIEPRPENLYPVFVSAEECEALMKEFMERMKHLEI
jgi:hypothetical protein